MKKVLFTLVCIFALTIGSVGAKAETTGVYVAPKFLMMWQNNQFNAETNIAGTRGPWGEMFNSQFTMGGALAIGYDFFPKHQIPIRAELEFAMRGDNKKSYGENNGERAGELKSLTNASTLMANFFYDFHNDSDFTPYITAGAGIAFIRVENKVYTYGPELKWMDESDNFTNFAWNIGAGMAYNINENIAVDLGYRYVNMGNVSMSGSRTLPGGAKVNYESDNYISNHEIALGVRFTF